MDFSIKLKEFLLQKSIDEDGVYLSDLKVRKITRRKKLDLN